MGRYKHKSTSIEEVSNRNFITESEAMSVMDIYSSNSQTVDIHNIGTIDSTIEGIGVLDIKAKSMVNLLERVSNRYDFRVGTGDNSGEIYDTNDHWSMTQTPDELVVRMNRLDKGFAYTYIFIGGHNLAYKLKPNTEYTFFADIYFSKPYIHNLVLNIQSGNATGTITNWINWGIPKVGWNRIRGVLTTINNLNENDTRIRKGVYIYFERSAEILSEMNIILKNAMLIEGNIPMSEYPGYFEGYTSCLDRPSKITSCTSNQLDITKLIPSNAIVRDVDPSRGYIKFKKNDIQQDTFIQFKDVLVESNADYTISYEARSYGEECSLYTFIYSENDTFSAKIPLCTSTNPSFNTQYSNKIDFGIYIGPDSRAGSYEIFNLRLTKGTDIKEFEPYRGSTLFLDALSLKELPTGVRDTIEGSKLIRRVGKVILNGSEHWYTMGEGVEIPADSKTLGFVTNTNDKGWNIKQINKHFTDRFTNYGDNAMYNTGDFEKIGTWSHGGTINIRIYKSRGITNTETFKKWLSENPVTLYYELEQPTVEYIDTFRIGTYEGLTHIETDSKFFLPLEVTTDHSVVKSMNDIKHEVIDQNNKLSSLKNIQFTLLNNLI